MTLAPVVARNLLHVRQQRGLTLTGLSEISGIAKSTLSALEGGSGNPTIQTLWALASALDIPFGNLLAAESAALMQTASAETDSRGASVRFIERTGSDPEIETYQMSLEPGCSMNSAPHGVGVMETVTATEGSLLVGAKERPRLLQPGETYRFRADVPHVYRTTERGAKAFVFIEYPARAGIAADTLSILPWPKDQLEREGALSLLGRLFIEVSNGLNARLIRFRKAGSEVEPLTVDLWKTLRAEAAPGFSWPVLAMPGTDEDGAYLAVLPERTTTAFHTGRTLPPTSETVSGTLHTARSLCRMAEAAHRPLNREALAQASGSAASRSWVLSSLGSEVLTQRGMLTVPDRLKEVVDREVAAALSNEDDAAFSSRIDVDHYDAFELLHPAYARQVVALAEDITCHGHESAAWTEAGVLDVGTGPGTPLLMLTELLPALRFTAIEPDPVAYAYLTHNIVDTPQITPRDVGFLELEAAPDSVALITSVGASHHFNTAFMLQKAAAILQPGGLFCVADEFLPEYGTRQERLCGLVHHHSAYILTALAWMARDESGPILAGGGDHGADLCRAFQSALTMAVLAAEAGDAAGAERFCRRLYTEMKATDLSAAPDTPAGAYARFFWLELQAMVAGFDYEVERKTYPRRFMEMAAFSGLRLVSHRRVFATTGLDDTAGGTHVFCFQKTTE